VPAFAFERQRSQLPEWNARKGEAALQQYQRETNAVSVDSMRSGGWANDRSALAEDSSRRSVFSNSQPSACYRRPSYLGPGCPCGLAASSLRREDCSSVWYSSPFCDEQVLGG
jgi:hypothetical protein